MDIVWKKESRRKDALYIDIFRKLNPEMNNVFGNGGNKYHKMNEKTINSFIRCEKNDEQSILYRKRGDEEFKQMKWYSAMRYYNRCICMATVGSVHLGIGYAKRAQCFFKLKLYEECILDLDLARYTNYPRIYYDLLDMREEECSKLIAEGAEAKEISPKLSFSANKNYPELANVLKINDADENWEIVAKTDIKVGQIVMMEKSFISSYTKSYQQCCICLMTLTNLMPCNKCASALMCLECNKSIIHRVECDTEVLFHDSYSVVSDLFRSVLMAMTIFDDADELMEFVENVNKSSSKIPRSMSNLKEKYHAFLQLIHKPTDLKPEAKMAYIHFTSLIAHPIVSCYFVTEKHQRFLMHLIFQHAYALKGRTFTSSNDGFENNIEFIDYTFILNASFSHSCAPQLTLKIYNGYAIVVTIRPIKKGETIHLASNEKLITKNFIARQNGIRDDFHGNCSCERCIFEADGHTKFITVPHILCDLNLQFVLHKIKNGIELDENFHANIIKHTESFLNRYTNMKWDDALGIIFMCYFSAIKIELNTLDCFENV